MTDIPQIGGAGGDEAAAESDPSELQRARDLLSATAIRALAEDRWSRWRPWLDAPLLAAFVVFMVLMLAPGDPRPTAIPPLDSIAGETVRAERDLALEDKGATEQRRKAAEAASLPAYQYDPDLNAALQAPVAAALDALVERRDEGTLDPAARRAAFAQDIGRNVSQGTFDLIERLDNPRDVATAIGFFLGLGQDRMVVADRGELPGDGSIAIRDKSRDGAIAQALVAGVMDVAQLRRLMVARTGEAPWGDARQVRTFVIDTATSLVRPNLVADPDLTEQLREEAGSAVEPVMVRIARGEVVIREGDRVTPAVQERLRLLAQGDSRASMIGSWFAVALLVLGLLVLGAGFFRNGREPSVLGRKATYMTLSVVAVTTLVSIVSLYAGRGLAAGLGVPQDAVAFLLPVSLATVVVALLVDARTSLLAGIALALLVAYRVDGDLWVVTHYVVGVLAAGTAARRCRRRSDLVKTGLAIAVAQVLLVPVMMLLDTTLPGQVVGYFLAVTVAGLLSGLFVAVLATALVSGLEWVFEETTDMRLLELASADNPLLKQLALRSPGTYYHSLMMANLAETAADAIGANGLQCRVMALYHDLGKMERPSYFAENQRGSNVHDRLPPELSARIIFAHIKDGIDIARKHRLGRPVIDAVTQHQGTTVLRVFLEKAKERAKATGETVSEEEFRYPGPRPMTKESGILMLADSIEAATRALKEPNPTEVRARVQAVLRSKIADGQLDDCALTMKDLAEIEAAFIRVLTLGVYHTRIEYPPVAGAPDPRAADPNAADNARDRTVQPLRGVGDRPA
jgi:putative nucleotidyltransferase with HDIG domain